MQKPQTCSLILAAMALFHHHGINPDASIFTQTFEEHGITEPIHINNLPDIPINPDNPDEGLSLQSLCSNLVTDMDDQWNTDPETKGRFLLYELCYPILDTVHYINN